VYSEWQPSAADLRFLAEAFPDAKHTYSFTRPSPDGWDKAFAEARRVIAETAVEPEGELLPVLWSTSSPGSGFLENLPHLQLVPGRLSVALAHVVPTPRGTLGMHHVTTQVHQKMGAPPVAELLATAGANIRRGLRVDVRRSERGDLLSLSRENWLAASALALDDFHAQMSRTIGDDRLIVGLPCPDEILVASAGSGWVDVIQEQVLGSRYDTTELVPSVVLLEPTGIRLLAERAG
jgi:hypothetical protein